ncbi:MAG: divergent polysaccharide deacetylase family protein [Alphaproteobacteria bacterium]|nr:divergent polysaccharide deacetylase family protein [Alphaproteobacteria bacterium]
MKRSSKLIYAWCVFIIIMAAFFGGVEVYNHFQNAHAQSYQYRILISEDVNAAEEKAEVNDEKSSTQDIVSSLYEETKYGMLPKISPDGMRVLDVYKASASTEKKDVEKISTAIIIDDEKYDDFSGVLNKLGQHKVSFIVPHYTNQLQELVKVIRENGHEIFLQLPTQSSISADKKNSVSPFLANSGTDDTVLKLNCLLASTKYVIGLANISSTLLTKSKKDMGTILDELSKRGVSFLDVEKMEEDLISQSQGVVCFSDYAVFDKNLKIDDIKEKNGILVPLKLLDEFLNFAKGKSLVAVTSGLKNADL